MDVKICQLLTPAQICLDLKATDKEAAIKEMANLLDDSKIRDKKELLNCLLEREEQETTGVGEGIALPHGRTDAVKDIVMFFARSIKGIDFQALDDKEVHLLFLIAAPRNESTTVLRILAKVSRFLNNAEFRQNLLNAKTPQDACQIIQEKENQLQG